MTALWDEGCHHDNGAGLHYVRLKGFDRGGHRAVAGKRESYGYRRPGTRFVKESSRRHHALSPPQPLSYHSRKDVRWTTSTGRGTRRETGA